MSVVSFLAEREVAILLTVVLLCAIHELRKIVCPPSNFPKNIPTIPFYVAFVGMVLDWGQERIYNVFYRKKLENSGAVKVYFGSRWNILVTRPEYLAQIFKQNDVFEKSGNHEKIPYSVLAEYTGDNVISAGNRNWRKYREIVTHSILFPDLEPLAANVRTFVSHLKLALEIGGAIPVAGAIQKLTLANIGDCVIGVDLHSTNDENLIHLQIQKVKAQIFRPLFMTLPFLDKFPIASRMRARETVRSFKQNYCRQIEREITPHNFARLGPQLAHSFHTHQITRQQFEDNAVIALVAGHENPQLLITSVLYVLAKHRSVQLELRRQLASLHQNKDQCELLTAVIFETLRMYPPLGQIINRRTTCTTVLGSSIVIPPGTYVGYNNFGTQRDVSYWGDDADQFVPLRWGTTFAKINHRYARAKSHCTLPAFHGRNRACLGEKYALAQVRKVVVGVVEAFDFKLDPSWRERLTAAGPICPVNLRLVMRALGETEAPKNEAPTGKNNQPDVAGTPEDSDTPENSDVPKKPKSPENPAGPENSEIS